MGQRIGVYLVGRQTQRAHHVGHRPADAAGGAVVIQPGRLDVEPAAFAARQLGAQVQVGQVRTRVDGGFIAELFPVVAERVSNMAPLYVAPPAQGIDLGPRSMKTPSMTASARPRPSAHATTIT